MGGSVAAPADGLGAIVQAAPHPGSGKLGGAMSAPGAAPVLAGLRAAGDAEAWREAGFAVEGDRCRIGTVDVELCGRDAGAGLLGWTVRGLAAAAAPGGSLDGIPTARARWPAGPAAPPHPNGVTVLDHVVLATPDFERTLAALAGAGLELRRVREAGGDPPARQGFYRFGDGILEVAGPEAPAGAGPASLWGLAVVADLDAAAARLGERLGRPRAAVQGGRRIATVRPGAGLGVPVAFMTPRPH